MNYVKNNVVIDDLIYKHVNGCISFSKSAFQVRGGTRRVHPEDKRRETCWEGNQLRYGNDMGSRSSLERYHVRCLTSCIRWKLTVIGYISTTSRLNETGNKIYRNT